MRRDPCLRRDLAVGFAVGRAGGPTPGRAEGDPDAETIRCLSSEVAALNLPRLLDPEASKVEVLVRLDYVPPSYCRAPVAASERVSALSVPRRCVTICP